MTTETQVQPKNYNIIPASQYIDISDKKWTYRSCGIVSLFMIMSYWKKDLKKDFIIQLIEEGLKIGAYIENIGWSHKGLVNISKKHGFDGQNHDYFKEASEFAFNEMFKLLEDGPVIISVYPQFNSQNTGGHLLVVYGYEINDKEIIFLVADPDSHAAENILYKVTKEKLINGWKKRFIKIFPATQS